MAPENKNRIARGISLILTFTGILVIIGWIFDIGILKSISPSWVSMKFDTAVAFSLSGLTLYFIVRALEGGFDIAQVVLSITSLMIILLMGVLFFSALFGIRTGVEDLFIKETGNGVKTVIPGRPSIPTMVNFILIALAGIVTMAGSKRLRLKLKLIGLVIATVGALAVVGYMFHIPVFYYFIAGINSAMACHTAVLFVLSGIGLICL